METINGYVEHIIFQNQETGYTVMNMMVEGEEINCVGMCKELGQEENIDVYLKMPQEVMNQLVMGQMTFQRAFSVGDMTAKGNFKTLRMLDEVFTFSRNL